MVLKAVGLKEEQGPLGKIQTLGYVSEDLWYKESRL
jgi:hypothetical protein